MPSSLARGDEPSRPSVVPTPQHVVVFGPTSEGGHPVYVASATQSAAAAGERRMTVATSLGADLVVPGAEVWAGLPPIRPRAEFRTTAGWILSRMLHYQRRDLRFLAQIDRWTDVDLVHWQEYTPWLLKRWIRRLRRRGIASVVTVHNIEPHEDHPWVPRRLTARWHRRALCAADALVAHSERMATELRSRLGPQAPPITVAHIGVWGEVLVRESVQFRGHLLVFGSLRRNKGIETACEVAALNPGWHLRICGAADDPPYFEEIRRAATESLAAERITLEPGFVPEDHIHALMSWADVVLLPYTDRFKAQSAVAHVAIGHGVPIVSFAAGAITDLIVEHSVGLLVEERSAAAMAVQIERLSQPGALDELRRSVRSARDNLTWARAGEIAASLYDEVLSERCRPPGSRTS